MPSSATDIFSNNYGMPKINMEQENNLDHLNLSRIEYLPDLNLKTSL